MEHERQFFSASELLWDREINAALADATFMPWRTDADGRQWYRLLRDSVIHAVPAEIEISGGIELQDEQ